MARKIEFTPINTSLENLQLQANANNLLLSELYYVTDYEVLAQATSLSTFKLYEIPTTLSELTDDATHRIVTDTEKTTWNGKADQSAITDLQTALGGKINNYTRSAVTTLTIDCSTADIFAVTLTANTSFSLTNVPTNKDKAFEILNNSGAEITITLPTSQFWESQTVKIGAGKIKEFTVRSNGTRQIWHASAELKNA